MGIRYISHNDIDFKKWDDAVNSSNSLIYSLSFYLDVVTNNSWDAIVIDDYRAVIALPTNRKLFGIPQLYQPSFVQQLGLVGEYTAEELRLVENEIHKRFKRVSYPFNHQNAVDTKKKTNLIIDLNQSYEEIESGFSSTLKKRLRKTSSTTVETTNDVEALVSFYKTQLGDKVSLNDAQYEMAKRLFQALLDKQCGVIHRVIFGGNTVAIGMFLKCNHRIINVFGASVPTEQFPNAMAVLITSVLKENANSDVVFDFEGSEIPGIQSYFKSFGSSHQDYPILEINRLPFWVKLALKLRR